MKQGRLAWISCPLRMHVCPNCSVVCLSVCLPLCSPLFLLGNKTQYTTWISRLRELSHAPRHPHRAGSLRKEPSAGVTVVFLPRASGAVIWKRFDPDSITRPLRPPLYDGQTFLGMADPPTIAWTRNKDPPMLGICGTKIVRTEHHTSLLSYVNELSS